MKVKANPPLTQNKYYPLLLSAGSALLFWLGWPVKPFPFLLFLAMAPLFAIEKQATYEHFRHPGRVFFGYTYLTLFLWNLLTTWWVYYSTAIGAVFMLLANALLMSIPFLLFRITKRVAGESWGFFGFVLYWVTFEYVHLNWDVSWPWLTLGNGLASFPEWVQWYEYTGVFGGTLWILLGNIAFYFVFLRDGALWQGIIRWRSLIYTGLWVVLPILGSYIIYLNYEEKGPEIEVVAVQPNINPYTEKFAGGENFIPYAEQVDRFAALSEQKITSQTQFVLWPESAFDGAYWESDFANTDVYQRIMAFKDQYPDLSLVTGMTSLIQYPRASDVTPTARYSENIGSYDVFNTAFFVPDKGSPIFYHKSRLVPGVEIMPYPQVLGFLSTLIFDLGGTSGGFGRQTERTVLYNADSLGAAPAICYESIYGDYLTQFVRNGARMIFIITNDGWWGNTAGHKQHLHYASLRAIETRRSIARSANTGISAFINQRGDIEQATEYWEPAVIRGTIRANDQMTFYGWHGDYLARTAAWLSVFVFLSALVKGRIVK